MLGDTFTRRLCVVCFCLSLKKERKNSAVWLLDWLTSIGDPSELPLIINHLFLTYRKCLLNLQLLFSFLC